MKLHQVAVPVEDLARATGFYGDLLGTGPTATFDPPGLAFFDLDGVRLLLDRQAATGATLYLQVADVADAVAALAARGVEVLEPAHVVFSDDDGTFGPAGEEEWLAAVRDTEGNTVCLANRRPAATQSTDSAPPPPDTAAGGTVPATDGQWIGELATKMGITVTEATKERLVATMPVAGNRQPYGLLHGGANAVLAETLGSIHAFLLTDGTKAVVGIDLNCTHHRSATDGIVTGVCTAISAGRTVSSFDIVISDENDRRLCTARLTCLVRPGPGSPPVDQATPR